MMGLVSEDIVTSLEQFERKSVDMWEYLNEEYDKVSPKMKQLAKQRLNSFKVDANLPV